jgi:FdhE protein
MTNITTEIEDLATEIDRLAIATPHASSLLQAFGPLLVSQHRFLQNWQDPTRTFPVDPLKYHGGIPLIRQCRLLLPDDPWQEAGLSVASAIGEGFPQFSEDMRCLSKRIKEEPSVCFALCTSNEASDQRTDDAPNIGIEPIALQLFQRSLTRLLLTKRARDMTKELASWPWTKGYCPMCGSFPHLAIIREKGVRWLQCSTCRHEWSFSRLTCPHCDHEDPQATNYLFVEGETDGTAFTCDKCSTYLLTSNQSGNLRPSHADLIALSLAHLDLILQEKGFLPMAACEWNTF